MEMESNWKITLKPCFVVSFQRLAMVSESNNEGPSTIDHDQITSATS
jgi:hypothetical protein